MVTQHTKAISAAIVVVFCAAEPVLAQCPGGWTSLASPNRNIDNFAVMPNGRVAAIESINQFGVPPHSNLLIYDPGVDAWSPVLAEINAARINITALPDGDILAAGCFTTAGNVSVANGARYRPSTDTWSPANCGVQCNITHCGWNAFPVQTLPSGRVVIAGRDNSVCWGYGLVGAYGTMYHPATDSWQQFPYAQRFVEAPNGDVFGVYAWVQERGPLWTVLFRVDATTGQSSTMLVLGDEYTSQGRISSLAMQADGSLIVTGSLTWDFGVTWASIARYQPATGTWSAFGGAAGESLFVLPDGDLITISGSGIYRYVADRARWFSLGPNRPAQIAMLPNGDLVRREVSAGVTNFARYHFSSACPVDFNCSGGSDVGDVFEYLSAWLANEQRADLDGSPSLTGTDILEFINSWFVGC